MDTPHAALPANTAIGAVELTVTDLQRALRFYGDGVGLRARSSGAGRLTLSATEDGPPLIELYENREARPKPARTTGLYHVAILFPSRRELANCLTRLIRSGVPLLGASDHLVSEAIYLDDPDGNGIELYVDRPRSEWPRAGDGVAMDTLPLDLNALLATAEDWSRPASPETTIGHIHLHVADLDRAVGFYRDVLGFDLMQLMGRSAAFLSAGGYHHHLGLNIWVGIGAPPPPPDAVGLRRFTIQIPDGPALDAVQERLQAAGVDTTTTDASTGLALETHDPDGHAITLAYQVGVDRVVPTD